MRLCIFLCVHLADVCTLSLWAFEVGDVFSYVVGCLVRAGLVMVFLGGNGCRPWVGLPARRIVRAGMLVCCGLEACGVISPAASQAIVVSNVRYSKSDVTGLRFVCA